MAGGPGASEVGRVGVRALPLTDKFAADLLKSLKVIEAKVRVEIPVVADTSRLSAEIDSVRHRQRDPISVPVKTDSDQFVRQVRADVAKIERTVEADIPLTADGEQFRRDLAAQVASIEALTKVEIPVDVKDAAAWRAKIRAQVAEVEAMAKAMHPTVTVDVEVNRAGLRQTLRSLVSGLSSAVVSAGQLAAGLAGAAGTATLLTTAVFAAGAALAAMSPALLVLVPAVAGLAATVGVLLVAGERLKTAFAPLADAFAPLADTLSRLVTAGLEPMVQAMAGPLVSAVAPGLQVVASTLNEVISGLVAFTGSAEGLGLIRGLLAGIGEVMRPLAAVAVPLAQAFGQLAVAALGGLGGLAQSLAGGAVSFAAWVDAGFRTGELAATITRSVEAMKAVFGGLGAVLGPLGELLMTIAPAAIDGFVAAMQAVGDIVTMLTPLAGMLAENRTLLQGLLLGAAVAAVQFAGPIGMAAGAITLLIMGFRLLQPYFGQISAALAPVTQGLSDLWSGISSGVSTVMPSLKGFAEQVGPVLSDLGRQIIDVVGPALSDLGALISDKLAPAFADFMRAAAPVAAVIIRAFGPVVVGVIRGFVDVVKGVVQVVAGVFEVLAGLFTGDWSKMWDGLKDIFGGLGKVIGGALGAALAGLKNQAMLALAPVVAVFSRARDAITGAWSAVTGFFAGIGSAIAGSFSAAVSAVTGLVSGLVEAVGGAISAVVGVVTGIWSAFWGSSFGQMVQAGIDLVVAIIGLGVAIVQGLFNTGMLAISAVVSTVWGVITSVFSGAVSLVSSVVAAGMGVVRSVVSAAMNAAQAVVSAVWGFIGPFVSGAVDRVMSAVRRVREVATIVGNAFRDAYNAAVERIGDLVEAARGIAGKVLSAIGDLGSTLYRSGQALVQGLIDGMTSKFKDLANTASQAAGWIKDHFPGSPVKRGPLRSFNDGKAGRKLMEMLTKGIDDGAPDVTSRLATIMAIPSPRSPSPQEFAGAGSGGRSDGVAFYGPVNLRTPEEAADLIVTRQRDADALSGLRAVVV